MRKLFAALRYGMLSVLVGLSLYGLVAGPVAALNVPAQYAPRMFSEQMVHYIRFSLQVNSCVQVSNSCTIKVPASLPYNALILRITAMVNTAFNSTSTDSITVGITSANHNEISSAGCSIHAQAIVACTVLAGAGSATGNGATQSGLNGGFDLFVNWTGGGGTPNAGNAAIVIEYVAPNDGTCTQVPMNATATGC